MSPLEQLLSGLDNGERQEFQDTIDYLTEHSNPRSKPMPEQSIGQVLNGLSPNVRDAIQTLYTATGTERMMPFQPKMNTENWAEAFGFDPTILQSAKQSLDNDEITAGLQQRMGTDRDLPQPELTRRDQIAAALEAHQGSN